MEPRPFRPGILERRDLAPYELRRLARLVDRYGHRDAALRFRALARLVSGESPGVVLQALDICKRSVFRWQAWYRSSGARGVLHELKGAFRQCVSCDHVRPRQLFTARYLRCHACRAADQRAWRQTPRGRSYTASYVKSKAKSQAKARYRGSPRGKAYRRLEHERRSLREAQLELFA